MAIFFARRAHIRPLAGGRRFDQLALSVQSDSVSFFKTKVILYVLNYFWAGGSISSHFQCNLTRSPFRNNAIIIDGYFFARRAHNISQ
jgi:hypothetical protein